MIYNPGCSLYNFHFLAVLCTFLVRMIFSTCQTNRLLSAILCQMSKTLAMKILSHLSRMGPFEKPSFFQLVPQPSQPLLAQLKTSPEVLLLLTKPSDLAKLTCCVSVCFQILLVLCWSIHLQPNFVFLAG